MSIPKSVLNIFLREAESTSYGRVSLGIIRRGSHEHYEIEKHITFTKDGEVIDSEQKEKTTEA